MSRLEPGTLNSGPVPEHGVALLDEYATGPTGKQEVRRYWSSMDDLLSWMESVDAVNPEQSHSTNSSWTYSKSYGECLDLIRDGWKEPLQRVETLANEVNKSIGPRMARRTERYLSTSGSQIHVGRYLRGDPKCAYQVRINKANKKGPIVRVAVNVFASHSFKASEMIERGAAVTALVEILQASGHSVHIDAFTSGPPTRKKGAVSTYGVNIKRSTHHADMAEILFALAHPSMFRRVWFYAQEHEGPKLRGDNPSMWSPGRIPNDIAETYDVIIPDGMGRGDTDYFKSPIDWVLAQVKGLGLLKAA